MDTIRFAMAENGYSLQQKKKRRFQLFQNMVPTEKLVKVESQYRFCHP